MSLKTIIIDGKRHSRLPTLEQSEKLTDKKYITICDGEWDQSDYHENEQCEQYGQYRRYSQPNQSDDYSHQSPSMKSADFARHNGIRTIDDDLNMILERKSANPNVYDITADDFASRYEETMEFAKLLRFSLS